MTFFDELRKISPSLLSDSELSNLQGDVESRLFEAFPELLERYEIYQNNVVLSIFKSIYSEVTHHYV